MSVLMTFDKADFVRRFLLAAMYEALISDSTTDAQKDYDRPRWTTDFS